MRSFRPPRGGRSEGEDLALLHDSQQLGLEDGRELADLVEKQGSVGLQWELPGSCGA